MASGRVASFEILRLLGRGATANVYECRHVALGRLAAIKVLHPHLARDKTATRRFLREARALARIVHPNVVEVFDVGEHEGLPYMVMLLVDGEDLAQHLHKHHPMLVADIADCILPVVGAVAAAHDAGIVHRDLKPGNIRLTRDHRGRLMPKVLDFGISKVNAENHGGDLTESEELLGTAAYMSPEQLRSAKDVDVRSDIYSLGVILYQCATGRRPFHGASRYDLMHAILNEPVAAPSSLRPELSPAFDAIVLRAMRRNPRERFHSARELGSALAPFASDIAIWTKEFATPSSECHAVPAASGNSESNDPSFTLISASDTQMRARVSRTRIAAAFLVCVAVVGVLVARDSARARRSELLRVPASSSLKDSLASVLASSTSSSSPLLKGAPSSKILEASAHDPLPLRPTAKPVAARPFKAGTPPPIQSAVHVAVATSVTVGTNGAPILE